MLQRAELKGFTDLVEVERSAHAVVFRAWQPRFRRHVAVEVFPHLHVEQFEHQRKVMGALAGHPNTVTVHEVGMTDKGVPFVVTELSSGESLAQLVARQGPLPRHQAADIVIKLAGVVESARRAGTDVTIDPHRVRMSRFGEPAVSAFGVESSDGLATLRAALEVLVGSPRPLPDRATTPLELAEVLQEVQREAGRPVTEVPLAVEVRPPAQWAPPDAVTLIPTSRRRARRVPLAVSVLLVVALAATGTAILRDRLDRADVAASLTGQPAMPVEPPLYRDGFTRDTGWKEDAIPDVLRRTFEQGQYRVQVLAASSDRQAAVWKAEPAERRVSVALEAVFLSPELTRIGVACEAAPGGVLGILGNDGRWAIQSYQGGPLASGRPVSPPGIRTPFRLELDCDSTGTSGRLTLWLDGKPLGEAVVPQAPTVSTVGYHVESRSSAGTDVGLRMLEVRRLR